ncbi:MAG: DUF1559 domain-containing protein, partial [Phycisphaerales bacterium JB063]
LVVISIIVLLIAILLPALSAARETARDSQCRSNLHQMGIGLHSFFADNKETMPGISLVGWAGVENQGDAGWLSTGGNYFQIWSNAPTEGLIYDYMESPELYLCPSVQQGDPNFAGAAGVTTGNGHFDYSMFISFAGAKIDRIPHESRLRGETEVTPIILEEDVEWYINRTHLDSAHGNDDESSAVHSGNGNYVGIDGSVTNAKGGAQVNIDWELELPSGQWVRTPVLGYYYGWWNGAN